MDKKIAISFMALLGAGTFSVAHGAGFEIMVPHRAVYDIKLEKSSDRSGIKAMKGRIVYEVRGNECDGITMQYRFLTTVTTGKDQFVSDQHTSTYESADGKKFDFLTKSFLNRQLERTVKGKATQTGDGVYVTLERPAKQEFEFTQAQFLTSYLIKLIELGKDGEHFLRDDLYDGSDGGDEVISTSTIISKLKSVADSKDELKSEIADKLDGLDAWSVSMSYFDKKTGATAEHLPVFESSFLLFENGISTDMKMHYPDYSLTGTLSELEMFENPACENDG